MLALRRANLIHRPGLPRFTPASVAAATSAASLHHASSRSMAMLHGESMPWRSPSSAAPRWPPATTTAAAPTSPVLVSALAPHWRAFSTSILLRAAENDPKPSSPAPPPSSASPSNVPTATSPPPAVPAAAPPKPFLRKLREDTWPHIKEEIAHYKEGSKLLAYEVKLSSRYLLKLMRGNKLSRREHRQLKRTVSDLFRLVPFAILVAIPFAELALPVLLKLFPNMLPSTFEKSFDKEEKKKKMLKMRLELAKFLQETVDEMAVTSADKQNATAALEFSGFFRKIRTTGEPPETAELIRVAQQFENELTLENLSRPQLVSMCKYMGINAFGTDNFLRFQVRNKMRLLHTDDQMIFFEGVESLSVYELQRACAERGIKTIGVSPARLRHDLQQWLDLHLIHKIPSSLLILSRAFIISDQPMLDSRRKGEVVEELPKTTAEALQATLQSLPPNLINEAELKLADQEGKASFKKKLEALKQQEEIIAEELEQEAQAAEEAKLRKQQEEAKKKKLDEEAAAAAAAAAAASAAAEPTPAPAAAAEPAPAVTATPEPSATKPVTAESLPTVDTVAAAAAVAAAHAEPDVTMSPEQVKELGEAIKVLVARSAVDTERVELESLKGGRAEKEKEVKEKEAAAAAAAAAAEQPAPVETKEAVAATPTEPVAAPKVTTPLPPAPAPETAVEPVAAPATPAAPSTAAPAEPAKDQPAAVTPAPAPADVASAAAAAKTSKATTRLDSQVEKLLNKISSELEQYELEMATDPKLPLIQANERGQITVQDLETALRVIRSRPADDAEIKAIVRKLDVDGDGLVALHELMELARSVEEVEGYGVVVEPSSSSAAKSTAAATTSAPAPVTPEEGKEAGEKKQ